MNESWVGDSISHRLESAKQRYLDTVGQKMQAKAARSWLAASSSCRLFCFARAASQRGSWAYSGVWQLTCTARLVSAVIHAAFSCVFVSLLPRTISSKSSCSMPTSVASCSLIAALGPLSGRISNLIKQNRLFTAEYSKEPENVSFSIR